MRVGEDAVPEVVDGAGRLYLYDRAAHRVVRGGAPDGAWETVTTIPAAEGALDRRRWLSRLGLLPSGDILVTDPYGDRILRLSGGRSTVFLTDESSLSVVSPSPMDLADGTGLLVRTDGGEALSVYDLPV